MNTVDMAVKPEPFQGNDKLLSGIILGVVAFWLFAQTVLNIAPDMRRDLGIEANVMNIAVAVTALFSGMFVVVLGGLADRIGRVRMMMAGFMFGIAGALLIGFAPTGTLAIPFLMLGRALQGLSAACIMPASLALVKTYWDGAARQRAVSLWSIGSWGGSGLCSIFGGFMAATLGWRWIFFLCAAVLVLGMLLVRGTPESKVVSDGREPAVSDKGGVASFMVTMIALQIVVTQGSRLGWGSTAVAVLAVLTLVFGALFVWFERRAHRPFIDFKLFANRIFTGATLSNFMLNGVAGMLIVSLQLLQLGGGLSAGQAGMLTLGYAVTIIAFIRVGEKLLQRFGSRKPMLWGCMITALSIMLLMPTHLMLSDYKMTAIAAYALFGIGLAFYATPSTDAALSNLPSDQAGSGAGIYKMASSLGSAFGVAISAAIFTALQSADSGVEVWFGWLEFYGRQDNIPVRSAAIVALSFNILMVVLAMVSVMLTIPKGKKS